MQAGTGTALLPATREPYPIKYAGTSSPADPDSDGDGVRDGADDQDHDDVPNIIELSQHREQAAPDGATGARSQSHAGTGGLALPAQPGRLPFNPFSPCLPDHIPRTCEAAPRAGRRSTRPTATLTATPTFVLN